ncbi:MAG: adenylate kinase family protein, partial [Methanosarcinaceae archaeon]|nr:adenylate kinase family protein [Methanosarcinaceae archaeon]
MLIGLTGTPGTGKTSVSNLLEKRRGYRAIHLNELIKEERLYSEVDEERDTLVADMDRVSKRVSELVDDSYDVTILDSHLSHHIADIVIVLRTAPDKLSERLSGRNYSKEKVSENVDAEALDVILIESVEWCDKVFEINTTETTVEDVAQDVDEIVRALL